MVVLNLERGHGFCVVGTRICQEMRVSNSAPLLSLFQPAHPQLITVEDSNNRLKECSAVMTQLLKLQALVTADTPVAQKG